MSTSFKIGDTVTYINASKNRSNGVILDVHSDAGQAYFTLQLEEGREVQTTLDRIRKGEHTGVGLWQRVLDANTNCYFFFNEFTSQTLWDTPESRQAIFVDEFHEQLEVPNNEQQEVYENEEIRELSAEEKIAVGVCIKYSLP